MNILSIIIPHSYSWNLSCIYTRCGGGTQNRTRESNIIGQCTTLDDFVCPYPLSQTQACNTDCPHGGSPDAAKQGCRCPKGREGRCCEIGIMQHDDNIEYRYMSCMHARRWLVLRGNSVARSGLGFDSRLEQSKSCSACCEIWRKIVESTCSSSANQTSILKVYKPSFSISGAYFPLTDRMVYCFQKSLARTPRGQDLDQTLVVKPRVSSI